MSITLKATLSVRRINGKFAPGNFAAVLGPARAEVRRDVEQAFAREADPVNFRRWPARKGDYDWPMLQKTGTLRQEAVRAALASTVVGSTLVVKVTLPRYGLFQMKGTRTIAPRRFVGVSLQTLNATRRRLKAEGLKVFRNRGTA